MVRNCLRNVFFLCLTLGLQSCSKNGETEKAYSIDWSSVTEDDQLNELVLANNLASLSTVNFAKDHLAGTWKSESGSLLTFNSNSPVAQVEGTTTSGYKVRYTTPITIDVNGSTVRMKYVKPVRLQSPSSGSLKCTKAEIIDVSLIRNGRVLFMIRVDVNQTMRFELQ